MQCAPCYAMLHRHRWCIQCFLLLLQLLCEPGSAGIGFCMDQVPSWYTDTGFAIESQLNQAACTAAGHTWCALSNDVRTHNGSNYYYYSPCCSGKQGTKLLIDQVSGKPTCKTNTSITKCTRTDWHNKFMDDYIDPDTSGYEFMTSPSTLVTNPRRYGGMPTEVPACVCAPTDPRCIRTTEDGTICLICERVSEPCNAADVTDFSMNFFKIHSVDLKTSELSFAVWMRQEWYDPRLSYDYQCYGGLEYFEVIGEPGSLENSQIWTPDIELYNSEENIWQGSLGPRMSGVYSCWDVAPTRGGCGYVFWSRPGIVKALCKYDGLVQFPYDTLTCTLEFGPWSLDGRFFDLRLRPANNGVQYPEDGTESVAGLTGGSRFQDYNIMSILAHRTIVRYASVPDSLYPELLYTVTFQRSHSFYEIQFVFPMVLLTMLTFISFWMNPEVTDRLGFSVLLILSLLMHNIIVATFMPVCEEKVLMDYLVISCYIFGSLSLLETGVVLYLYNLKCETWYEALFPGWLRKLMSGDMCERREAIKSKSGRAFKSTTDNGDPTQYMLRKQMYHQIFYAIDRDFGGSLSLEELDEFGYYIAGTEWDRNAAEEFLKKFDENWDGVLDYEEFAGFCEENLLTQFRKDPGTLREMIKGFLIVIDKKIEARKLMWMMRATLLDQFCRWAIPPGFVFFLILLFSMSKEKLSEISTAQGAQFAVVFSGLYPILFIFSSYGTYHLVTFLMAERRKKAAKKAHMQAYQSVNSEATSRGSISNSEKTPTSARWPARAEEWPAREDADDFRDNYDYDDNDYGNEPEYAPPPPARPPPRVPPVRPQAAPQRNPLPPRGPPAAQQRFQTAPIRGNSPPPVPRGNAPPPGPRNFAQF